MPRTIPVRLLALLAAIAAVVFAVLGAYRANTAILGANAPDPDKLSADDAAWLARRKARPPMPPPKPGQTQVLLLWRTPNDVDKVRPYLSLVDHPEGVNGVYGIDIVSSDHLRDKVPINDLVDNFPVPGAWLVVRDRFGHLIDETPIITKETIATAFEIGAGRKASFGLMEDPYLHKPAPDFVTTDQSGKTVSLSGLRGKRVILSFYCGCDRCAAMAEALTQIQNDPANKDLQWYAVTHMTPFRTKEFMKAHRETFTALNETDAGIASQYNSKTCPRVWYINPKGDVAFYGRLSESPEVVVNGLRNALQSEKVKRAGETL